MSSKEALKVNVTCSLGERRSVARSVWQKCITTLENSSVRWPVTWHTFRKLLLHTWHSIMISKKYHQSVDLSLNSQVSCHMTHIKRYYQSGDLSLISQVICHMTSINVTCIYKNMVWLQGIRVALDTKSWGIMAWIVKVEIIHKFFNKKIEVPENNIFICLEIYSTTDWAWVWKK